MILAGSKRKHLFAVDHDDETGLLALEKLLDHHARAGSAHLVVHQHHVDGVMSFVGVHRHHHPFARGEPVGLDDDRCALPVYILMGGLRVRERLVSSSGNPVADHERLGKILRGFQLGRLLYRSEDLQSRSAECVDDALRQRCFRSDNGDGDRFLLGELHQFRDGCERQVE